MCLRGNWSRYVSFHSPDIRPKRIRTNQGIWKGIMYALAEIRARKLQHKLQPLFLNQHFRGFRLFNSKISQTWNVWLSEIAYKLICQQSLTAVTQFLVPEEGILPPHRYEKSQHSLYDCQLNTMKNLKKHAEGWQTRAVVGHNFADNWTHIIGGPLFWNHSAKFVHVSYTEEVTFAFWIPATQWAVTEKKDWYKLRRLSFSGRCGY